MRRAIASLLLAAGILLALRAFAQTTTVVAVQGRGITYDPWWVSGADGGAVNVQGVDGGPVAVQCPDGGTSCFTIAYSRYTYAAPTLVFTPGALTTDACYITGSATKTVRVTRIDFYGYQNNAGEVTVRVAKRSTANTGGTCTTATRTPYDSTDPAPTATVTSCTANPVTGTLVGYIDETNIYIPTNTGNSATGERAITWTYGPPFGQTQSVHLRGTGEVLAVNFAGVTNAGLTMGCTFEWTEGE